MVNGEMKMDKKKLVAARKVLEKDGYDVVNFLGETVEKEKEAEKKERIIL